MEIDSFLGSGRSVYRETFLKIKKSAGKNAEKEQENPEQKHLAEKSRRAHSSSRIKSLLLVGVVVCFVLFCIAGYLDVDSPTGDVVFSEYGENYSAPVVLNKSVYPEKVAHGDVLLETLFLEDEYGIESVTGEIEGIDNLTFSLIDGTLKKGTWQNAWIVHTTENMKWYTTTIVIRNVKGETTATSLLWQDPTVYHPASEVTAGTFDAGDFTFPDNVVVQDNLTVDGNISVTGTVDGRDVSTDGAKLDGIETGATADQTASEILTAIKTVDGSGSGLDADLLDGYNSTAFIGATCTIRTSSTGYASSVSCLTGETLTGGGCHSGSATDLGISYSYPSGSTWYCRREGTTGSAWSTAYAICCTL